MWKSALAPIGLLLGAVLMASAMPNAIGASATHDENEITYSVGTEGVEIHSANTTILISNSFPAASVRAGNLTNLTGDGFVIRSFLGYNASAGGGFSPDLVEFRAPANRSTWSMTGPHLSEDSQGTILDLELSSSLDMIQVTSHGGGYGGPGSGGPASVVSDWAQVTIRFSVSTYNHSSTYEGIPVSPSYALNGSSELKFDVRLVILRPLPVDTLALEVALMKMNDAHYVPSATSGLYELRGYQGGGTISNSSPSVNETQGTTLVIHDFVDRNDFKQIFEFVNETGTADGFFSWASQAKIGTTGGTDLANVSAFYRTDGESLSVYLSTPLTADTVTVEHDPSVGVFGGSTYPVVLPVSPSLETSAIWIVVGVAAGAGAIGGVGALALSTRARTQDPADSVDLLKNRYYRGPRE